MLDVYNLTNLCLEIKYDLEGNWGLQVGHQELYSSIERKQRSQLKFLLESDTDFIVPETDSILFLYFDLEDRLIEQDLSSLEKYTEELIEEISEKIKMKITSLPLNDPCRINYLKNNKIYVYYFSNHYGKMLQVEKFYDIKSNQKQLNWNKKLVKAINEKVESNEKLKETSKNISFMFKHLNQFKSKHTRHIKIDSRVRRTTTKPLSKANGEVYTASLYDLAELFAVTGVDLFKDNLRLKVDYKSTDVDEGITRTLKENPEEFWYLNNGITLLVGKDHIEFSHSKDIRVDIGDSSTESENQISVINGAQTLNAAAEFFYDLRWKGIEDNNEIREEKQKEHLKKIENAKKNAFVILRIIRLNDQISFNVTDNLDWVNKIAIALNSQKPIKKEDLVSTVYFTQAINMIYEKQPKNEFVFKIIKRGEIPSNLTKKYFIKELAKILVTYIEKKPAQARGSIEKNIKTTRNENTKVHSFNSDAFLNQDILYDDTKSFKSRVDEYKKTTFDTMYRPVNYLMLLNERIEQFNISLKISDIDALIASNSSINEDERENVSQYAKNILTFGKYHLILCIFENELSRYTEINELYSNGYYLSLDKINGSEQYTNEISDSSFIESTEVEDTEDEDTEDEDTEVEDTEVEDTEDEDTEVEDTEDEDTEDEDTESEDAEIEVKKLIEINKSKIKALSSWNKSILNAESTFNDQFFIKSLIAFVYSWNKNIGENYSANIFKTEQNDKIYLEIIKDFIEKINE